MAMGFSLGKFFDGPFPLDYLTCAPRDLPNKPTSLFGQSIQAGILSIFHSGNDRALDIWEKQVRKGHIKKVHDVHISANTLEIMGANMASVFITTPIGIFQTLGVRLPFLVFVVKNLRKHFMFDVLVLDDKNLRRRLRFTNSISTCRIKPHISLIPLALDDGWNEIKINLPEILQKTYSSAFKETVRVQVHGNCRLRRILFCEKTSSDDTLPADVKAFIATAAREAAVEITQPDTESLRSQK
ncbi:Cilia- and flagella-associated protein 20 [Orchesella cincta]|uniref:Cilia-and flagella-associated protein 20 n=1 Tax=Orchesella cincta TaxID=48709 RepID=A0A1D2MLQ0_ORCCI|nr:Cilia- and flagella-associated protein 20 [Orchesella cincta]